MTLRVFSISFIKNFNVWEKQEFNICLTYSKMWSIDFVAATMHLNRYEF